jgi:hypothetical protein
MGCVGERERERESEAMKLGRLTHDHGDTRLVQPTDPVRLEHPDLERQRGGKRHRV